MIPRLAATLLHFLWQGTLIAGLYSMVRNYWPSCARSASLRYALACGALASMAILPVLTFMASDPGQSSADVLRIAASRVSWAARVHTDWFAPAAFAGSSRPWPDGTAQFIVFPWCAGALAFLARFLGGWLLATRLRSRLVRPAPAEWQVALDRLRMRLGISRPVQLLVSGAVQVPTVVGCLRPLVLVPVGALTGLTPEFLEALFAHELAHIRRHDYLFGILQCIVEATLFYHPAVWWISQRIREERENCCDDIAVTYSGNPLGYARALAELESLRPAQLHPALAASGASLTGRIARVLCASHAPVQARRRGLGPLAVACVLAGLLVAQRSGAQSTVVATSALPSFEAASIRPSDPDSQLKIQFARGGRLLVSHATLRFLIKIAYDVSDDQLVGGPSWLGSRRFDVQAKPDKATPGDPEKMTKDELLLFHEPIRLRLQRLLAERFGLELRKESKPMPIFALVVAKSGPKLKPDASSGDPVMEQSSGRGVLRATRADMDTLARFLSEGQTGRPVVNMTGLKGNFDFQLDWTPDAGLNPQVDPNRQQPADIGGISLFTALQQQVGLRLDPRTGLADTLIVTRAELPSSN
jgi:uncharacterized protein (TIGR03435 family)